MPVAQDVEDAFQATFLVLVRKARSLSRPDQLSPWLYGVARRIALKARTEAARRRMREKAAMDYPAHETSDVLRRELRLVLDEEVGRLPARYRTPFLLCYLEGLTNEEAARRLGCPKGTVLSRLARAREQESQAEARASAALARARQDAAQLIADIETLQRERDDLLDTTKRLQADFENYRRRRTAQRSEEIDRATGRIVEGLLPVLDACEAAFAHGVDGIEPIWSALIGALQKQGDFRGALEEMRRGHALRSKRPFWPHPSDQWLRQCEHLVELDQRLQRG